MSPMSQTTSKFGGEWLKRVLWGKETKVILFEADEVTCVWRRSGDKDKTKFCRSTIKNGGENRLVWACMSWKGGQFWNYWLNYKRFYYREISNRNLLTFQRYLCLGKNSSTSKMRLRNWIKAPEELIHKEANQSHHWSSQKAK